LAHLNTKSLPLSLVLVGSVLLAACSSKPSPWAESASPWDSRQQQVEPEVVVAEEVAPTEFVDMAAVEVAPVEESMYAEPVYAEPMPMSGEVMPMEAVAAEPAMMEPVAPEEVAPVAGDLSAQPAEYFVVQVVASSTMAQLNDFANANSMSNDWVAETNVNGKTWYVLILGVYPTKSEADQALASVSNMGTQPWVRSVRSLQSVMN
jgi:DamX protein